MKYQTSNLSQKMTLELWFKLHQAMETESINWRVYIDHEQLAKLMGTNRKYISQVVNQVTGLSIPSYLNLYRIQAFRKEVKKGALQIKTIEGIAREVGFENRATFYRVYKKYLGITPTHPQQKRYSNH